jgi:pimeloyl-ACP methyl ester carboxylesterase
MSGSSGGWCYQHVAQVLRAEGHDVYTPTLTGLGDRSHLLTPEVGLDTHIADVASLLFHEDLRDVILAGHSYGGIVIAGTADRSLDRVGQLVFLDAAILYDGECLVDDTPALPPCTPKRRWWTVWTSSSGRISRSRVRSAASTTKPTAPAQCGRDRVNRSIATTSATGSGKSTPATT